MMWILKLSLKINWFSCELFLHGDFFYLKNKLNFDFACPCFVVETIDKQFLCIKYQIILAILGLSKLRFSIAELLGT